MKIIPAIDIMEGQVVRLYKGDPTLKTTYYDDPIIPATKWEQEGADMIHVVDLDATLNRGTNVSYIKGIIDTVKIPVQVAGGLRDIDKTIEIGNLASRIVIGTMAFTDRESLDRVASDIGKEKIVISVDHNDGNIVTHGWQSNTDVQLQDAIQDFVKSGYMEFLLTDITKDGTMKGPDLKFLKESCDIAGTSIIASGGISSYTDIERVRDSNAAGVILGKALYENKINIRDIP